MSRDLGIPITEEGNYYFISYNTEDSIRISPIVQQLHLYHLPMWYDKGIHYGSIWEESIANHIAGCTAVILFFTKQILEKKESYVFVEYEMAKSYFKKPIYVVFLDEVDKSMVPNRLIRWMIELDRLQCIHKIFFPDQAEFLLEILNMTGYDQAEWEPAESSLKKLTPTFALNTITESSQDTVCLPKTLARGDILRFGHFPGNSAASEIEWIVLHSQYNQALLLSLKILTYMPYHNILKKGSCTWATSTLRKWLNHDFFQTAFSDQERIYLLERENIARTNPKYHTPSGHNTIDRIFLLDCYDLNTFQVKDIADLSRQPSPFQDSATENKRAWWLRDSGFTQNFAMNVEQRVHYGGLYVNDPDVGVRPAILLSLQK